MNLEIFSHAQKPFFIFLPSVHLSFICWGFYFSELSLEIVIISQFLCAWRKRVISRRTVIISFCRFKGMFFFSFFSQAAVQFMIKLFLEPVCGMSGFSLRASSRHVSQQRFINCLLFLSFIHIIIFETLQVFLDTLYGFHYIRIQFHYQLCFMGVGTPFSLLSVVLLCVHDLNYSFNPTIENFVMTGNISIS